MINKIIQKLKCKMNTIKATIPGSQGFRLFFLFISTQNKAWQWERQWLMTRYDFTSLSMDYPSAKCCFTWLPREYH